MRLNRTGARGSFQYVRSGPRISSRRPNRPISARAKFNGNLHPGVVCGQHGWWQPASELGQPGYPAFGEGSANLNLVLSQEPSDPISGSSPLRASLCEVTRDNG